MHWRPSADRREEPEISGTTKHLYATCLSAGGGVAVTAGIDGTVLVKRR